MPTGKVKWYDAERGFGFLAEDSGDEVYVRANALPAGVTTLKGGQRVEFDVADGRKGKQALHVRTMEPPPSVVAGKRKKPEDMVVIIEDVIKLLDDTSTLLRKGRYPEKGHASKLAAVLRAVAADLDA